MTSPSNDKPNIITAQVVNQALDASVDHMPQSVISDLDKIRNKALMQPDETDRFSTFVDLVFNSLAFKVSAPIAAIVLISLTITNQGHQSVPQIPEAMMSAQVPTEDFMLLEELEFITWLAESEQNALL